jgi:ATP-dependent Clp protease ATP-binding subunit ClpC
VVDFRNTVLIMTSNLGTEYVHRSGSLGFVPANADSKEREAHEKIEKALKSTFRPEFLNRIDEIITFSPLSLEEMAQIVDLQLKEVQERLSEHGLIVELTEAARQWLAHEGYNPAFGARPLKRALQKYVESPLSVRLLSGDFEKTKHVVVDVDTEKNELVFRTTTEPQTA